MQTSIENFKNIIFQENHVFYKKAFPQLHKIHPKYVKIQFSKTMCYQPTMRISNIPFFKKIICYNNISFLNFAQFITVRKLNFDRQCIAKIYLHNLIKEFKHLNN